MTCCKVHPTRMSPEECERELEGDPLDWMSAEQRARRSDVARFLDGAGVLVTGATGFLGTSLLEKLLRTCTGISTVYVLARDKKGVQLHERVRARLDSIFFSKARAECPDCVRKVVAVAGDCALPGLGLSDADAAELASKVSVIFHVAATVRFDEALRVATTINVAATRDLIALAKRMPNLKAFVYISTAYSNCHVTEIEEKIYPPAMNAEEILKLVEILDDDQLAQILPLVLGDWPNTYVFTKSVAEDMLRSHGAGLPISIVRPSIVVSSAREPFVAWVDNVYGPIGAAAGAGVGLVHTMQADFSIRADLVPIDLVTNATIACAWDTWRRHSSLPSTARASAEPTVYNIVSGVRHPISWGNFLHFTEYSLREDTIFTVWHYHFVMWKKKWMHDLYAIFVHLVPALIVDAVLRYKGMTPVLWNSYARIHKFSGALARFSTQEWTFREDNVTSLLQRLSPVDRKLFNFDIVDVDWQYLLGNSGRGLRFYLANENFDDRELASKKVFRLKVLHYTILTVFGALFLLLLWWMIFT